MTLYEELKCRINTLLRLLSYICESGLLPGKNLGLIELVMYELADLREWFFERTSALKDLHKENLHYSLKKLIVDDFDPNGGSGGRRELEKQVLLGKVFAAVVKEMYNEEIPVKLPNEEIPF